MYAIVEIAGKQYKVQEKDKLVVPRLNAEVDDSIRFDRVLLVADGNDVHLGTPVVANAAVTATVVEHVKGDKVLVFRKKRRKRFKVLRGHRQPYTRIEVSDLSVDGKAAASEKQTKAKSAAGKTSRAEETETQESAGKRTGQKAEAAGKQEAAGKATGEEAGAGKKPAGKASGKKEDAAEEKTAAGSSSTKAETAGKEAAKASGKKEDAAGEKTAAGSSTAKAETAKEKEARKASEPETDVEEKKITPQGRSEKSEETGSTSKAKGDRSDKAKGDKSESQK